MLKMGEGVGKNKFIYADHRAKTYQGDLPTFAKDMKQVDGAIGFLNCMTGCCCCCACSNTKSKNKKKINA